MRTPRNQPASVLVLHETETDAAAHTRRLTGNLDAFLKTLPKNTPGRDRSEIAAQVEAERTGWDQ
jgi:hypothetical protein